MNTELESADDPQPVLGYAVHSASPLVVAWCRLLAIGMLALGIERFAEIFGFFAIDAFNSRTLAQAMLVGFVVCMIWPLLAWYCWHRAPQIAVRLVQDVAPEGAGDKSAAIKLHQILGVAILTLGVYEIGEALPTLLAILLTRHGRIHDLSELPWMSMAMPLVRLALGIVLIYANHAVIKILCRLSDGSATQTGAG